MQVAYLYNEKLPKRTAHDVYIWRNVYFLSQYKDESEQAIAFHVNYITGESLPSIGLETLQKHYLPSEHHIQGEVEIIERDLSFWNRFLDWGKGQHHQMGTLSWTQLPLMRKSGPLRLSWNLPFFLRCQCLLEKQKPDWVLMSVYKQADFHLKRKIPGVRYLFEVHDLAYYPGSNQEMDEKRKQVIELQKRVLNACDSLSVTTPALKQALLSQPYHIQKPIHIVPLASEMNPLPTPPAKEKVTLGYVGQLYEHQGVDELIQALAYVENIQLEILGGSTSDLDRLKNLVYELKLDMRVHFHGFVSPQALSSRLYDVDALVAPFHPTAHMCHVSHTKLIDYGRWALPVIAPNLPITREEVRSERFLFDATHYPKKLDGLIHMLEKVLEPDERLKANEEIQKNLQLHPLRFTWKERTHLLSRILKNEN